MFNFDLKKAKIYQAVKWGRCPVFRFGNFFKKLFFALFALIFLFFLCGFFSDGFSERNLRKLLGFSVTFFVLAIFFRLAENFFESKLKQPKIDSRNLAEFLGFGPAQAVFANPRRLLLSLLQSEPKLKFIFNRLFLDIKEIKKTLREASEISDALEFQKIILEALKIAQKNNHSRIESGDLISALAEKDEVFRKILVDNFLKAEDIENLALWLEKTEEKIRQKKRFWDQENLAKRGTLAKEWTAGYTITLDKYGKDISETVRRGDAEIIGHKEEIEAMERILARREINNVLIIGEPGTGRKSMIFALAQKSLFGRSLPSNNYKRVIELDMAFLLAQIEGPEEVETVLSRIFSEVVEAGNVILVIDEFHNYIGQSSKLGMVDISGIITSYLRLPQFPLVAITTYEGLHNYIEKNSSILSLFEKVEVSSISQQETLLLLEYLALSLEKKHGIFIFYPSLREIINLTDRYFPSLSFPEKAMSILDETAVYVASSAKEKVVMPKHVRKIITDKTQVPVGEIESKEKETLLNLEDLIHQRIINQEEAVREVSAALRRARSEITIRKGPMGCFLFLGPTGVGKTETAKALAEIYFGSENKMIRLDMSEFQNISDIARLLGSSEKEGLLTTPVRENSFSLVLLDEFEKAHPNILNLFLQVLDEGSITDGIGRKVDFRNTIIIATSNAGYQIILEAIKKNKDWLKTKKEIIDHLFKEGSFHPELINRFDAVVLFKPLTKENLLSVAQLLLSKLKNNLQEKEINFIITEGLKEKIVELGYNPIFGAREMRRVIQDKLENVLATALLSKQLTRGSKVEINPKDFKLIINS